MQTSDEPEVVITMDWGRSWDGWELVAAIATVPPVTFRFFHHELMKLQGTAECGPLQAYM